MFTKAKNDLIASLNKVFNLDVRIDNKSKDSYQDCVLYLSINTVRAFSKNEIDIIYFVTGTVFLNIESACSYSIGLLEDRAFSFNKIDGLYFAKQEVVRSPFTTLNFEFYSKSLQLNRASKEVIEDINNNIKSYYD